MRLFVLATAPALFAVLASALAVLFVTLSVFLYPMLCSNALYSQSSVAQSPYVMMHGKVLDLRRSKLPQLQLLASQYAGKDISSLLPLFYLLARRTPSGNFFDPDIGACIADTDVTDSWLEAVTSSRARVVSYEPNTRTIRWCADPITRRLNATCLLADDEIGELNSAVIGDLGLTNADLVRSAAKGAWIYSYHGKIYNMTMYMNYAVSLAASPEPILRDGDTMFLSRANTTAVLNFTQELRKAGGCCTGSSCDERCVEKVLEPYFHQLWQHHTSGGNFDFRRLRAQRTCYDKLFYAGRSHTGQFVRCLKNNWPYLAFHVATAFVVLFKICLSVRGPVKPASWMVCWPWKRRSGSNNNSTGSDVGRARKGSQQLEAGTLAAHVAPASTTVSPPPSPLLSPVADRRDGVIFFVPLFAEPGHMIERNLRAVLRAAKQMQASTSRPVLLFVVCDGAVCPQGSIKETYHLVLQYLRHSGSEPTPTPYTALGQGNKRHNQAKVYAGQYTFYDDAKTCVPFVVVSKIGNVHEPHTPLPGNRGKRDSQLLLLRLLNKVQLHTTPLTSLESTLLTSAQSELSLDLASFQFLINIDGDVAVEPDAPGILIAKLEANDNLAAACGRVDVGNPFASPWAAMSAYRGHLLWHIRMAYQHAIGDTTMLNPAFAAYRLLSVDQSQPFSSSPPPSSTASVFSVSSSEPLRPVAEDDASSPDMTGDAEGTMGPRLCLLDPSILQRYGKTELTTLFDRNIFLLGEDLVLSHFMLYKHPSVRLSYVTGARALTLFPTCFFTNIHLAARSYNVHLFYTISKVFSPLLLIRSRIIAFLSLAVALLLPTMALLGLFTVMSNIACPNPVMSYCCAVWLAVVAFHGLVHLLELRSDLFFQMLLFCTLGIPIHLVLVPILAIIRVATCTWVDQWPCEERLRSAVENPELLHKKRHRRTCASLRKVLHLPMLRASSTRTESGTPHPMSSRRRHGYLLDPILERFTMPNAPS